MTLHRPLMLVVDDEPGVLEVVSRFARRAGFEVTTCSGGGEAMQLLRSHKADVALVDLRMPDVGGLDVLRAMRDANPSCHAILMTGYASIETAVEAVKLGAMDYMTKPLDFERLARLLTNMREDIDRRRTLMAIESDVARQLEFCGMIGRGPIMQEMFGLVRRLAPHIRTALITGETGTGKELMARALHDMGPRKDKRFVTVNCSAVVETLFESELFGHVRGAFTGATDNKAGLFELADGGTLFLDEVGELPLSMQAKLLRVLELGEVYRVGSTEVRRIDVHVVAATNRDLRTDVAAGRFRSDLFYRLSVVELKLPALREHPEDIPYLTAAFLRDCAQRLQKPVAGLTTAAERILVMSRWEGNVRELRNVVERACILSEREFVTETDVARSMPPVRPVQPLAAVANDARASAPPAESELLSTVEREHIQRALQRTGGNKKAAARMLGLSRRALYRRLERLNLTQTISRRKHMHSSLEEKKLQVTR